jgi:predicted nuclease of predicted toxin-antitoxin system
VKVLIDNALSPVVSIGLERAGFDTVHVRDIGMQSSSDIEILVYAESQNRTIISADTDFGTLLTLRKQSHPSFVLLRRQKDTSPVKTTRLLIELLPQLEDEIIQGSVIVISDDRVRIRKLPIIP